MNEKQTFELDRTQNYIEQITPRQSDLLKPGGYNVSFHWELSDGRNIFLYAFLNVEYDEKGKPFIKAKSNLSSEEVRGQGKYLWEYLTSFLSTVAKSGYKKIPPLPVVHIAMPNTHSMYLVKSDGYQKKDDYFTKMYL